MEFKVRNPQTLSSLKILFRKNCPIACLLEKRTGDIIYCCCFCLVLLLFFVLFFCFIVFFTFHSLFKGQQHDFYKCSKVQVLCCCYNIDQPGETLSSKGLRQLRLINFNVPLSLKQVCGFQNRILIARFLRFVYYIVRICDQESLGVYSQSNLLDRMLRLHTFQPCSQDYLTIVLIFNTTQKMVCYEYCYCLR